MKSVGKRSARDRRRLLTFEVQGGLYALPITSVLEVAESERIFCVPSIAIEKAGVMNWHGDALPVVTPSLLLQEGAEETESESVPASEREGVSGRTAEPKSTTSHVLVVSDRSGQSARLGLPVQRVLGLVDAESSSPRGRGLVIERRPVDGRVVSVLDPGRLVAKATGVIKRAAA